MTTDATRLMRLQSWLSPAFPIGAYSYSHGLEWAVEAGAVRDRVSLVDWLDADIRHGAGRTDGIFFAEAWRATHAVPLTRTTDGVSPLPPGEGAAQRRREAEPLNEHRLTLSPGGRGLRGEAEPGAGDDQSANAAAEAGATPQPHSLLTIAELAAAMRATSELALESSQQGIAFLSAVRKAWPHPALDDHAAALRLAGITPMLPVAAGMCCAVQDIALEVALPLYLHAGAANLINAAVRLIPLGQTDGQMALAALEAAVAETAAEVIHLHIADIGSAAFMIDIASMQHETQYTRLFRS